MTELPQSKRKEPKEIKHAQFWKKRVRYTREMEKMSTIRSHSLKAELHLNQILGSSAHMLTDPIHASLTTLPSELLIDIWECRFGNDWVDLVELVDDPFFIGVAQRLRTEGELEAHYLTDRARLMCRKPREEK
jgi:hypothetical protein